MINVDAYTGRKLLLGFPTDNLRVKDILPFLQLLIDVDLDWPTKCQQFGEHYMSLISRFLAITCSMRSPYKARRFGYGDYCIDVEAFNSHPNIYLTVEANVWATYKDLWGADGEYGTARGDVFVNQKITKVVEAGDQRSTYVSQGSDITYQKQSLGEKNKHAGQGYDWVGWSRLESYKYAGMVEHAVVNEAATVYLCIPLSEMANYMKRQELAKQFNYLTKFQCVTGRDESTMVQNTEDSYRDIFAHPWPESLRKEIGLIGEPCRIQIL